MPTHRTARPLAIVSVACVLLFWICALLAGALTTGYSLRDDYISSLAGRGSAVAVLGIIALTLLGAAHLAAAAAVRGPVGIALGVAGLAGLTVAAFRTNCPAGAAGCGWKGNDPPADGAQLTHGYAVVVYEIAIVAAMLIVATQLSKTRPPIAVASVAIAVISVLLALQIGGPDTGWWQRGWLLLNTGWLVGFVLTATSRK